MSVLLIAASLVPKSAQRKYSPNAHFSERKGHLNLERRYDLLKVIAIRYDLLKVIAIQNQGLSLLK